MRYLPTLGLLLLTPTTAAQEAAFEWQKVTTKIAYNAVPVGKHSLADLKVGETWRIGKDNATVWTLPRPLVGDGLLPAGAFRIALRRDAEDQLKLVLAGSGLAIGEKDDLELKGFLQDLPKPNTKLDVRLWVAPKDRATGSAQGVHFDIDFGTRRWHTQITTLGVKTEKAGPWQLDLVECNATLVRQGGKAAPIGVLSRKSQKGPTAWNLVLAGDQARLLPVMSAPTEMFGFGEPTPPDPLWCTVGTAAATDRNERAGLATLDAFTAKNGTFTIKLAAVKEDITIVIPEPKGPKG